MGWQRHTQKSKIKGKATNWQKNGSNMRTKTGPFPQQLLRPHKKARPQEGSSKGSRTGQERVQVADKTGRRPLTSRSSGRCRPAGSCHLIFPGTQPFQSSSESVRLRGETPFARGDVKYIQPFWWSMRYYIKMLKNAHLL